MNNERAYPEVYESISAAVIDTLVARGIDVPTAQEAGQAAAERVRKDHGGTQPYLPKGVHYELDARDRAIYEEWNGRNDYALCRKHDITPRHLKRIIAAKKEEDQAARQGKLSV